MALKYKFGDAANPELVQLKRNYIAHVCNDEKKWGSGFVLSLNKHSQLPKQKFLEFSSLYDRDKLLGCVCFSEYINKIKVINMIAQNGVVGPTNPTPIKYDALEKCMKYVAETINDKSVIHAPKFGAGLARGNWEIITKMIEDIWCPKFEVMIYELPK